MLTERRRCAVLGSPVSHSLSPVLHRAAYRHLGLDWTYTAHEVAEDELKGFLAGLDRSWRGLSLTMPLKRVGLELATQVSGLARAVGAVNTLLIEADGRLLGENTDVPGMVAAVGEHGGAGARRCCVWGGGATAAGALAAVSDLGSREVHLHARDPRRAGPTLAVAAGLGLEVDVRAWRVTAGCGEADLVFATAPAGAMDALAEELGGTATPGRLLFDVVYDPWPTPLAAAWSRAGGAVVSGLDLLVHQAAGQVRLMTGRKVPVPVLRDAVR